MSTQTEGCLSRKSSGSSVYGIRWNHISFMGHVLPNGVQRQSRVKRDSWMGTRQCRIPLSTKAKRLAPLGASRLSRIADANAISRELDPTPATIRRHQDRHQ